MFVYKWYTPCTVVIPHPKPPNNAREYSKGKGEREAERTSLRRFWLVLSRLRERVCTKLGQAGRQQSERETALGAKRIQRMPRWLHATFARSLSHTLSLFILLSRESKRAEREGKGGLARNRARSAQDTIRNVQSFSRAVLVRSFVAFVRFWFSIRLCFSFENIHL